MDNTSYRERNKILQDFQFQTDKMVVANQSDIVVVNKPNMKAVVVEVTIPSDSSIMKKEHEKLAKYQRLKEKL